MMYFGVGLCDAKLDLTSLGTKGSGLNKYGIVNQWNHRSLVVLCIKQLMYLNDSL